MGGMLSRVTNNVTLGAVVRGSRVRYGGAEINGPYLTRLTGGDTPNGYGHTRFGYGALRCA
jgi:hypothetical protein